MGDEHPSDATVAAFLDGALDEPARAIVLSHVDGCSDCRLLLADAVVAATGKAEFHEEIGAGSLVASRYRIERPLGRGGFGAVYLARDEKLGRAVALKILVATNDPDARLRFEREARVLAELEHPNVVRVIDFGDAGEEGQEEEQTPFLVLERLEGETFAERLQREGPLPISLATKLTMEVLSALGAAHARGVIHRDLKPGNVFLVTRSGVPSVRVLDFGIAKLLHGGDRLRTATGAMLGTPAYMAPEQLLAAEVDARTDVHAVGTLLFEMLAGRRPFVGDRIALVTSILVDERPRVDTLRAEVPTAIADVVAKALSRRPEARFADAAAMAAALDAAVRAASPTSFGPRRVFAIGLLSAVSVGLLGAAGLIYYVPTRPPLPETPDASALAFPTSSTTTVDTTDPTPIAPLPIPAAEAAGPPPNCVCHYNVREKVFNALCPAPQVPKCSCGNKDIMTLCETPPENGKCLPFYYTFGGPGKKTNDPCTGYAFVWKSGGRGPLPEGELQKGVLDCNVCYQPVRQHGVHKAPCRGLDSVGKMNDGIWICGNP